MHTSLTPTRSRREMTLLDEAYTVLADFDLPLTAPGRPGRPEAIDRTTLAWACALRLLTDHRPSEAVLSQVFAADALLRELGTPGLAVLQRDLSGDRLDFRFIACAYCDGENPEEASCTDLGCQVDVAVADHAHACPACDGADYQPVWWAQQNAEAAAAQAPAHRRGLLARLLRRR